MTCLQVLFIYKNTVAVRSLVLRSGEHLFYRSLLDQVGGKGSHDDVSNISVILLGGLLRSGEKR